MGGREDVGGTLKEVVERQRERESSLVSKSERLPGQTDKRTNAAARRRADNNVALCPPTSDPAVAAAGPARVTRNQGITGTYVSGPLFFPERRRWRRTRDSNSGMRVSRRASRRGGVFRARAARALAVLRVPHLRSLVQD